jgi:hypothetical protein
MTRTLWRLHLDGPTDSRLDFALALLREGQAVGYRGVALQLRQGSLDCCCEATWRRDALTRERALSDFVAMRERVEELRATSAAFASVVDGAALSLSLVEDYGTGVVELCRLVDGDVVGL